MKDQEEKKGQAKSYVKYTGIAFQMLATIGIFAFIGYKVDEHYNIENYLTTALLGVVGVGLSLFQVIKSLNRN